MYSRNQLLLLVLGDALALLGITLVGFASHGIPPALRWLSTWLPFCLGWALIAPWLGLFRAQLPLQQILWRVPLAALLAAPFAAWLRGLWLNSPILPLFVVIMAATNALGLLLWRGLFSSLAGKKHARR